MNINISIDNCVLSPILVAVVTFILILIRGIVLMIDVHLVDLILSWMARKSSDLSQEFPGYRGSVVEVTIIPSISWTNLSQLPIWRPRRLAECFGRGVPGSTPTSLNPFCPTWTGIALVTRELEQTSYARTDRHHSHKLKRPYPPAFHSTIDGVGGGLSCRR